MMEKINICSTFNYNKVVVKDPIGMKNLNQLGYGKGNLSRNHPLYNNKLNILRKRQITRFDKLKLCKPAKVIVVPDSMSDNECGATDYFTNVKVNYELTTCPLKETLNLSLEEAFYLKYNVNCLEIEFQAANLSVFDAWNLFIKHDEFFIQNYVVFCYYKARNWVIKSALKFGGDFVLYKEGPDSYHSNYVVVIDNLNKNLERLNTINRRSMRIKDLLGLNRLCETAGKELLICQIIWPESINPITKFSYENISEVTIKEIKMNRCK